MGEQPKTHPNSEKKIENTDFQLKIGTTNNLKPEAVYIESRTFITPMTEKDDYEFDVRSMKHFLNERVRKMLDSNSNVFDNRRYILDFDVATSGMGPDRKSFLTIEITLRQRKDNILKLKELRDKSSHFINETMYDLSKTMRSMDYIVSKNKD